MLTGGRRPDYVAMHTATVAPFVLTSAQVHKSQSVPAHSTGMNTPLMSLHFIVVVAVRENEFGTICASSAMGNRGK